MSVPACRRLFDARVLDVPDYIAAGVAALVSMLCFIFIHFCVLVNAFLGPLPPEGSCRPSSCLLSAGKRTALTLGHSGAFRSFLQNLVQ